MLALELRETIKGEVLDDAESRAKASRDYSIFSVTPEVVVAPHDEDDLNQLVRFVNRKRAAGDRAISLTGRSAGTDMSGGPLNESIIVSFTPHLNHIREVKELNAAGEGYAVLEPGVYFRDFEKVLQSKGLLYPPYPASKDLCAIGGIISNNSGGEKTLSYGKTADYVQELRMVLADGETHTFKKLEKPELNAKLAEEGFEGDCYRKLHYILQSHYDIIQAAKPHVSKNSSGYALWDVWDKKTGTFDMTRLFCGAQGTLGLMSQVKVKLVKDRPLHGLGVIFLKSLDELPKVTQAVLDLHPETFESYDDRTLEVALRFLPDLVRTMKTGIVKLAFQFFPEFLMALRGGLPKLVLLVEFAADDEPTLKKALTDFKTKMDAVGVRNRIIEKEKNQEKYWTVRRQSFALLHNHNKNKSTVPFVDDIAVKPEYLPDFLPRVNAILDKHKDKMVYTVAGHVGDGNFHIIPLMDLRDPEVQKIIPEVSKEIYALVHEYQGSITAEHNDGLIRTPYLEQEYGAEICKIFAEVKAIFDPQNIFNPRKKVGGDLSWSAAHMNHENF
jgi:FAD/FMN-containing dehydrogenase